jgi:hypothetical protein
MGIVGGQLLQEQGLCHGREFRFRLRAGQRTRRLGSSSSTPSAGCRPSVKNRLSGVDSVDVAPPETVWRVYEKTALRRSPRAPVLSARPQFSLRPYTSDEINPLLVIPSPNPGLAANLRPRCVSGAAQSLKPLPFARGRPDAPGPGHAPLLVELRDGLPEEGDPFRRQSNPNRLLGGQGERPPVKDGRRNVPQDFAELLGETQCIGERGAPPGGCSRGRFTNALDESWGQRLADDRDEGLQRSTGPAFFGTAFLDPAFCHRVLRPT